MASFQDCESLTQYARTQILKELESKHMAKPPDLKFRSFVPRDFIPRGEFQTVDLTPEHAMSKLQASPIRGGTATQTDGKRVVTLDSRTLRIVDISASPAQVTDELNLETPNGAGGDSLFLHDDRVLVIDHSASGPSARRNRSRILDIDISKPGGARIKQEFVIEGRIVSATQVDSFVRFVLVSSPIGLEFRTPRFYFEQEQAKTKADVDPFDARFGNARELAWQKADREARLYNEGVFAKASAANFLPHYKLGTPTASREAQDQPLYACSQVMRPGFDAGFKLSTVFRLDLAAPVLKLDTAIGVMGSTPKVHASTNSVYLAQTSWTEYRDYVKARSASIDGPNPREPVQTYIHRFDVSSPGPAKHQATGRVPGQLALHFPMSERKGVLRVGVNHDSDAADPPATRSYLAMLDTQSMDELSRLEGIGLDQRVLSMRYIGDFAYAVTALEDEPVRALDLRSPESARVLGKFPAIGYGSHIHVISPQLLVVLRIQGSKRVKGYEYELKLFDTKNIHSPKMLHRRLIPVPQGFTEFLHQSYRYDPDTKNLLLSVRVRKSADSDLRLTEHLLVHVDPESGFTPRPSFYQIPDKNPDDPLMEHFFDFSQASSVVVGNTLWTASTHGMRATQLQDGAKLQWLDFQSAS